MIDDASVLFPTRSFRRFFANNNHNNKKQAPPPLDARLGIGPITHFKPFQPPANNNRASLRPQFGAGLAGRRVLPIIKASQPEQAPPPPPVAMPPSSPIQVFPLDFGQRRQDISVCPHYLVHLSDQVPQPIRVNSCPDMRDFLLARSILPYAHRRVAVELITTDDWLFEPQVYDLSFRLASERARPGEFDKFAITWRQGSLSFRPYAYTSSGHDAATSGVENVVLPVVVRAKALSEDGRSRLSCERTIPIRLHLSCIAGIDDESSALVPARVIAPTSPEAPINLDVCPKRLFRLDRPRSFMDKCPHDFYQRSRDEHFSMAIDERAIVLSEQLSEHHRRQVRFSLHVVPLDVERDSASNYHRRVARLFHIDALSGRVTHVGPAPLGRRAGFPGRARYRLKIVATLPSIGGVCATEQSLTFTVQCTSPFSRLPVVGHLGRIGSAVRQTLFGGQGSPGNWPPLMSTIDSYLPPPPPPPPPPKDVTHNNSRPKEGAQKLRVRRPPQFSSSQSPRSSLWGSFTGAAGVFLNSFADTLRSIH